MEEGRDSLNNLGVGTFDSTSVGNGGGSSRYSTFRNKHVTRSIVSHTTKLPVSHNSSIGPGLSAKASSTNHIPKQSNELGVKC